MSVFSCRTIGLLWLAGVDEGSVPGTGPTMMGSRTEAGMAGNGEIAGALVEVEGSGMGVTVPLLLTLVVVLVVEVVVEGGGTVAVDVAPVT